MFSEQKVTILKTTSEYSNAVTIYDTLVFFYDSSKLRIKQKTNKNIVGITGVSHK